MFKFRFVAFAMLTSPFLIACGQQETTTPTQQTPSATESQANQADTSVASEAGQNANTEVAEDPIPAKLAALPAPYNTADYDKGRRQYATCRSCHLLDEGAGHRVGPNLFNLFNHKVGQAEKFKYSKALQEADFEWTPEKLDQWLANPREFLPNNRMTFAGISNATQRTNLIAYLMIETAPEAKASAE
ncbi:c-type cytochrome [Hirschia litorea]|uniref:C-type cytochrome n=1 Tax=Hirschia litorea TaxID=1199156 RepID=A0ABW2IFX8_9PROT